MSEFLELKGIAKSFGDVQVLNDVNVRFNKGEVHALMGENGAGKSTMMKILTGIHMPTSGEIFLKGESLKIKNPREALSKGISMIHQELSSIKDLSIAENIFLGREPVKYGFIDYKEMFKKTEEVLNSIGVALNPKTKIRDLKVSDMQMVEICKAISYDAEIIIMDEPTSAITDREVEKLFGVIRDLKDNGKSIIYISHKMKEIYDICDVITVLRDGDIVATKPTTEVSNNELISMMVGRELEDVFPDKNNVVGEPILSIKNFSKQSMFNDINFEVRKGEILGIAGLMGAGRTEVVESIFGLHKLDEGEIQVNNKTIQINGPWDAIGKGIALVTEDRKEQGLALCRSVKENISISSLASIDKYGVLDRSIENEKVNDYIKALRIKLHSKNQEAGQLSGGNQQKIVLAKWLMTSPSILILDEPTRGIDIGAKSEIYKLMVEFANKGFAIIMISSELPEILGMSDRVLVFSNGEKTGELTREEANQEKIMEYATANLR
ncbi:sugar ABC transporter ATP-binding protein [Aquibacillus sediminis]|uniref:sugar ABC transporter ATP-binding protein n=1 Tax=Aquibacillus sediminis TaxID=2574734 RepID=UPI0011092847|nr:sugar ABC transporter ATP-binding protein [Aquibacillus sediminis]